eukprot:9483482-Pyramimonas_sp.AAC.1
MGTHFICVYLFVCPNFPLQKNAPALVCEALGAETLLRWADRVSKPCVVCRVPAAPGFGASQE